MGINILINHFSKMILRIGTIKKPKIGISAPRAQIPILGSINILTQKSTEYASPVTLDNALTRAGSLGRS